MAAHSAWSLGLWWKLRVEKFAVNNPLVMVSERRVSDKVVQAVCQNICVLDPGNSYNLHRGEIEVKQISITGMGHEPSPTSFAYKISWTRSSIDSSSNIMPIR